MDVSVLTGLQEHTYISFYADTGYSLEELPRAIDDSLFVFSYLSPSTVIVSILLHGCTTWTLSKRLEKKLDGNYTRMLRAI